MTFFLLYLVIFSFINNLQATNWWDSFKTNYDYKHQNYAQAAQKCERLVISDPQNAQNLVNMGKILYQQAQYAQASKYFKQVLDQHASALTSAQKTDLWFDLGSSYASQEQWQQALDSYEQLLQIDVQNVRAKKNIEIIKKLLAQQKQDQDQKQDQEKPEKSKSNSEHSCDQNKNDQNQGDQNQGDQDQKQDQSSHNQDQQGKQDQPKQTNSSHDRQTSSSDQDQAQAKQAAQEQLQKTLDAKLSDQEKQYLQAIEKNDQQVNAYLAQKQAQALRGQEQTNENNW